MQLSSALPSKQLGSIFHLASTFLLPSFVLCLLYATYLSQPVILPNKTTSLGKKGQFEGSLPGLPEPFKGQHLPWPSLMPKTNKRQLLQKIPTVITKSI